MKKIIYMLLLLAAVACHDEVQMGCQTGILKTGDPNQRIYIRCCTKKEHQGGNNPAAGGAEVVGYYTSVQWKPTSSCDKCD